MATTTRQHFQKVIEIAEAGIAWWADQPDTVAALRGIIADARAALAATEVR